MKRTSITTLLALACLSVTSAAGAENYSAIDIKPPNYSYQPSAPDNACCGTLVVLAEVLNTSDQKLENPVFEARLLDNQGQLVDALHETFYGLTLMPGQPVAARVTGLARYGPERYASVQMRLVSGEFHPMGSEIPHEHRWHFGGLLQDLLMAWGPVLLLIGVWLWLVKRSNGVNYQKDVLELMKQQSVMLARQATAIEKIAQMRDTPNI